MGLAELATRLAGAHPGESGFRILDHGADAFAARLMLAERAERTLDLQYYLVDDGQTTRLLADALLSAADRGVTVRILLDATVSPRHDSVATLAAHPGIEVRVFNPLRRQLHTVVGRWLAVLAQINRLHRRMHNKLWIADAAIAIFGGRNLGDEYFSAGAEINFADLDLLALGPVVKALSASFDAYWHSEHAVPVDVFHPGPRDGRTLRVLRDGLRSLIAGEHLHDSAWAHRLHERGALVLNDGMLLWGRAQAIWDDPQKILSPGMPPPNQLLEAQLLPLFAQAQHRLTLVSAYFVPGADGLAAIRALRARGAQVRVLTNSLEATDVPFVYGAYTPFRRPLLDCGVELHELKARLAAPSLRRRFGIWGRTHASLHSKAMVFDGETTFVGSYNLDPRSRFWNTEVGVLVHSKALAQALETILNEAFRPGSSYRLLPDGNGVRHVSLDRRGVIGTVRPHASLWKRLLSWIGDRFGPREYM